MFVKIMVALVVLTECLANACERISDEIFAQENDLRVICDVISNCHIRKNKLPIVEKFYREDVSHRYAYSYFPPSFTLTLSTKKNDNILDMFRYSIFNTCTYRNCDSDGGILLNASQEPIEDAFDFCSGKITPYTTFPEKAIVQMEATYTSSTQLLDIIGFRFFCHMNPLRLSVAGGIGLGYSKRRYDLIAKNIKGDYNLTCAVSGRTYDVLFKYLPPGNKFHFSYHDKLAFIGLPIIAKGLFEVKPLIMEFSSKICPHIGFIVNECNIVGKFSPDYIAPVMKYPDLIRGNYSYSTDSWMLTYPGATLELTCKCLWDIASENYNIQLGVGYEWFSFYYIYFTQINERDSFLETISRIYNMRDSVIYAGYILSLGVDF